MKQHTVYIEKNEISEFCSSSNSSLVGYAYEWENEDVIHMHLYPIKHSFGNVSRVLFTKNDKLS